MLGVTKGLLFFIFFGYAAGDGTQDLTYTGKHSPLSYILTVIEGLFKGMLDDQIAVLEI